MKIRKSNRGHWWTWASVVIATLAILVAASEVVYVNTTVKTAQSISRHAVRFPTLDSKSLTPQQATVMRIARTEYETQPAGTKYSQGVAEPWCADFVSWVMKEAGAPLANPNSGSWRIPGTMTLRDYFRTRGNWHAYGDGYMPRTGDIAIYDGNGPHGQHTNFVISYTNGILTTVGGNEGGAIHVQQFPLDDSLKAVGFASMSS